MTKTAPRTRTFGKTSQIYSSRQLQVNHTGQNVYEPIKFNYKTQNHKSINIDLTIKIQVHWNKQKLNPHLQISIDFLWLNL